MSAKHRKKIDPKVATTLWIRAAGRCQMPGCNKILYRNDKTLEHINQANIAHIKAYNNANRWDEDMSDDEKNNIDNLMLVCYDDHKVIDKKSNEEKYDVETLRSYKQQHEDRIEILTGIMPEHKSHIVYYGAKIGSEDHAFSFRDALDAMIPATFPVSRNPIHLGLSGGGITDKDQAYWDYQSQSLESQYNSNIKPLLKSNAVKHLSIFGLAPMPLLMKLGSLITELHDVEIFQKCRTRNTWKWNSSAEVVKHTLTKDSSSDSTIVVLNLSLSASIHNDRIKSTLGDDISIYKITHPTPSNTYLQTKETLEDFIQLLRNSLDKIKLENPRATEIHLFPSMPISAAISTGRAKMAKADLPFIIYDQNIKLGGFFQTIKI